MGDSKNIKLEGNRMQQ